MISRRWGTTFSVVFLSLVLAALGSARAQLGVSGGIPGYTSADAFGSGYGAGISYGANPFAAYTGTPDLGYNPSGGVGYGYGYGLSNGQVGAGYQSAGRLYQQAFPTPRSQTTIALQPLYDVITAVPGWSGRAHRARRRLRSQPSVPRVSLFDDAGKIFWPSTIPDDPAAAELRRTAEAAVQAVVRESKSTGHASVRPVIDAKNKLSAFERKALPEVKARNATDAHGLETFFLELDKTLDRLTLTY